MRRMISAAAAMALHGGLALGFDQDGFGGDAVAGKIGMGHFAFGEAGVAALASGGQDARREVLEITGTARD